MSASIPDKFLDSLPKSFLILVILGGFVIAFTSPVWLIIEKWLPDPQSLNEIVGSIAIILSSSLIVGIPVILLETPIVGNNGLYSRIGKKIHKNDTSLKDATKETAKPNFTYFRKVGFYGWLNQNGCIKFLDQLNLQNSIVNALIAGFTISLILNLAGIVFVVLISPVMNFNLNHEIIITILTFIALLALLQYNRKWWKSEREEALTKIGEEYEHYLEEQEKKKKESDRSYLPVFGFSLS